MDELNTREEIAHAGLIAGLAEFIVVCLTVSFVIVCAKIGEHEVLEARQTAAIEARR